MIEPTYNVEQILWNEGYSRVLGIDEVGRGSYAGPLFVGGVIFPKKLRINRVRDSKLLSAKQRNEVAAEIKAQCEYATGYVEHFEIDELGLTRATEVAIERLVASFDVAPDMLLVDDGNYNFSFDVPVQYMKEGDKRVMSIAAGSIVAKVERDAVMQVYGDTFPEYEFHKNKGYASKAHRDVLEQRGPCDIHRKSFAPIAKLLTTHAHAA